MVSPEVTFRKCEKIDVNINNSEVKEWDLLSVIDMDRAVSDGRADSD